MYYFPVRSGSGGGLFGGGERGSGGERGNLFDFDAANKTPSCSL